MRFDAEQIRRDIGKLRPKGPKDAVTADALFIAHLIGEAAPTPFIRETPISHIIRLNRIARIALGHAQEAVETARPGAEDFSGEGTDLSYSPKSTQLIYSTEDPLFTIYGKTDTADVDFSLHGDGTADLAICYSNPSGVYHSPRRLLREMSPEELRIATYFTQKFNEESEKAKSS